MTRAACYSARGGDGPAHVLGYRREKSSGSQLVLSDGCLRVFWQGRAALTFLPIATWQLIIHMQNGGIHGASPSLHGGAHRFPKAPPSNTSTYFGEEPRFTGLINTTVSSLRFSWERLFVVIMKLETGWRDFFLFKSLILTMIILGKEGHVNMHFYTSILSFITQ